MTIIVNRIAEGQQVPTHQHEVEEVLVITAGQCLVEVGPDSAVAAVGDAVVIPANTDHSIRYCDTRADVICILASAEAKLNTPEQ
jgi:quercetin dioxygenase-like cupin family protein